MPTASRLLTRVSAPSSEPITLSEAKLYLRIDHNLEDALINDLIMAARMQAEQWLRRSLITQSWKLGYDDGNMSAVPLPMGPVIDITSVTLILSDGSTQLLAADAYKLNEARNTLAFTNMVAGLPFEIVYSAGYSDATYIPRPIKLGMLAGIASMYDGRADTGEGAIPAQALGLYAPYREVYLWSAVVKRRPVRACATSSHCSRRCSPKMGWGVYQKLADPCRYMGGDTAFRRA